MTENEGVPMDRDELRKSLRDAGVPERPEMNQDVADRLNIMTG